MRAIVKFVVILAVVALCAPFARTQIISTSLPVISLEEEKAPITAHFMVSPLGSWAYKEVWFGPGLPTDGTFFLPMGTIGKSSYSQILLAAEVAIPLGRKGWTTTLGGWYNRISEVDYEFDGVVVEVTPNYDVLSYGSFEMSIPVSLNILEGHAGLFYRSYGVQVGIIRANAESDGDFLDTYVEGIPLGDFSAISPFDVTTTDFTFYGVYKRSGDRWGISAGLGAYLKQGITEDSPLRFADDKVVISGFLTGNIAIKNRVSLDFSYWFIGKTGDVELFEGISSEPSDAQSRLVLGLGYNL